MLESRDFSGEIREAGSSFACCNLVAEVMLPFDFSSNNM